MSTQCKSYESFLFQISQNYFTIDIDIYVKNSFFGTKMEIIYEMVTIFTLTFITRDQEREKAF